jgi:DNA polymerase-3 subunit epsilon
MTQRYVVLDTETTGINPLAGHRLIEIGCVELLDRTITGKTYHTYINPEREVDAGAFQVHGISREFLDDKPLFKDILSQLLAFISGAQLIIHNAPFDCGFLTAELTHQQWPHPLTHYCSVIDTLLLARQKHPGQRNTLDALCKRYDINIAHRQLHGALLDAQLLAQVYLGLTGGHLFSEDAVIVMPNEDRLTKPTMVTTATTIIKASDKERALHEAFIQFLIDQSGINRWDYER